MDGQTHSEQRELHPRSEQRELQTRSEQHELRLGTAVLGPLDATCSEASQASAATHSGGCQ
eukprot:8250894-Heterocapsa_arctica.AAC.1